MKVDTARAPFPELEQEPEYFAFRRLSDNTMVWWDNPVTGETGLVVTNDPTLICAIARSHPQCAGSEPFPVTIPLAAQLAKERGRTCVWLFAGQGPVRIPLEDA